MCEVRVTGGTLPQEEINAYIDRAREKYRREPRAIDIAVDGDFVELRYEDVYKRQLCGFGTCIPTPFRATAM